MKTRQQGGSVAALGLQPHGGVADLSAQWLADTQAGQGVPALGQEGAAGGRWADPAFRGSRAGSRITAAAQ